MKYLFLVFLILFSAGFSLAAEGDLCDNYGESVTEGNYHFYCDFNTSTLKQQGTVGAVCMNNFECVDGYSCLSGTCTGSFNELLDKYAQANALVSGYCLDGPFCSNISGLANANLLTNKNCSYRGAGFFCYQCKDATYTFNDTLGACITGICSSTPGCLSSRVNNSVNNSNYCSGTQQCFSCDSDYVWNTTLSQCVMKSCTSTPGCLNMTNLTNGLVVPSRVCSTGTCFSCISGRSWNSSLSACVLSSTSTTSTWNTVSFTFAELTAGTHKLLSVGDKVPFDFAGRTYFFGLLGADSKISFKIDPTFNNQNLYLGESRAFDLDSDGAYDLNVSLLGLSSGKADVNLKFVSVSYLTTDPTESEPYSPEPEQTPEPSNPTPGFFEKNMWALIVIGVVFIALLIGLIFYLISRRNDTPLHGTDHPASAGNPIAPNQPRPPVMPGNAPGAIPAGGYHPLPPRPFASQNPQFRPN
ncbi:MAG: hypothetical protein WCI72_00385 [archaeon]